MNLNHNSKRRYCIQISILLLVLLGLSFGPPLAVTRAAPEAGPVTTVLLVRHAEKAAQPEDDPPLTPAGRARAEALRFAARNAGVRAIFATNLIRTQQTVEPAAMALGLPIRQRDIRDVDGLVRQILDEHRGRTVLVAGHGGTVPRIIQGLGGDAAPTLTEADYDNLFVVFVYAPGKARVLNLKYGDPS